ncbi:hypothetical protein LA080_014427 [Diaporthe eres]|nr:hypothetical protein LA080_014427 [Diaporthe eres]
MSLPLVLGIGCATVVAKIDAVRRDGVFWALSAAVRAPGAPYGSTSTQQKAPGYPRFTALLAAYDPYVICRRFTKLRARLLLLKQDRLTVLEERLEEVDQKETCPMFLGVGRCDGNAERASVLSEIESQLADYDRFVQDTHRMMSLNTAQPRDIQSLQNWLGGNGCLAEEECAYLAHCGELVCLAPAGDNAMLQLEAWVEDRLVRFWQNFRKGRYHTVSDDPNVYIYSGPLIQQTARAMLLLLITFLLLMPVVICNIVGTLSIRVFVVVVSTILYLLVLSVLTKSKTIELILAGATYATVLIVFVSGTSVAQG